MKKTRFPFRTLSCILLVLFLLPIVSGCISFRFGPQKTTTPAATSTTAKPTTATTGTTAPSTTPAGTTATAPTTLPTTAATTTKPMPAGPGLFGNTNGNLANGGFAVYDPVTSSHLLGINGALLRYDPKTGKTATLLERPDRPTHLLVGEDHYYFISSSDQAFYRVSRDGSGLVKLADGPCTYAGRTNHYVQLLQGGQLVLLFDGEDDPPKGIHSGEGVIEPSMGSNRVYYISGEGDYRVSANTGMGRTTVYKGTAFQAVHHLFYSANDQFVYVDRQGAGETVYLLPSLGEPSALAAVGTHASIPSLNSDYSGRTLYYIGYVDTIPVFYSLDLTSGGAKPVQIARLEGTIPRVCIVEGMYYVLDAQNGTMLRLDPDTGATEPVMP